MRSSVTQNGHTRKYPQSYALFNIIIQVAKVMVFEKLVSPLIPKAVYLQVTVL